MSQDLAAVFGTPAGSIWVGRVFEKPPVPNYPVVDVAEYPLQLVLSGVSDLDAFDANIVRGDPVSEYRLASSRVRVPLPKSERGGSIYEIQTKFRPKVFAGHSGG